MVERIFTVLFVRVKNCFCYLSANNLKDINTGETVRLTYDNNDKFAFLSVGASTSANIPDYAIGINSLFAKQLGLNENENVILGQQPKLPIVKSISICPLYKSDYEILELLSQTVQSTLLHQIRTVYKNQRFVIWIGDSIFVYAQIETVYPMSPGLLDNLSEVVIKPPQKFDSSMQCPKIIPNNMTNNKNTFKEGMCPIITENSMQNYTVFYQKSCTEVLNSIVTEIVPFTNAQEDIYKYSLENKLVYRALSINSDHLEAKVHNYVFPFNIFVLRKSLPQSFQEINTLEECLVLQIKLLNSECFDETQLEKQLFVRLYSMEDLLDEKYIDNINLDSVLVHDSILNYFNCYSGTRLILERITKGSFVEEIVIRGKKSFVVDLKESLQTFLADQCKTNELILNSKFVLNLKENVNCMLEFLPVEATYCFVDKAFLRKCKFSSVDQAVSFTKKEPDTKNTEKYLSNVSNISDLIGQCVKKLEMDVMSKGGELETFILVGKTGTGKSTIIQLLEEKLELPPLFCYTEIMQCKSIKGKTIDSLQKLFTTIFTNLTLHQPSVLILDDLHVLCENVNDGDALAQNALYVNRISEMICNLLTTYIKQNQISIIATTESLDKLNKHIYSSRGNYLLSNILEINNLNKSDRLLLLEHLFGNYKAIDLNLEEIGIKTDGFVIQDMVDFTKKTIFESLKDDTGSCQNHIKMEHCERALENTTVLSLQDIKLCESDAKDFTSIGGLHDVKKTLIESLSWPLKYPELFKNAPLRPQSGLLLFGPPGTGKTLIAGAVAQQCSLRLISVKGPELLSKYIGASEQSVRDVFQKAQNARPCILFFDEFDSLAPRRGHDNTGVTDRVVNQLLTQLDGVESLSGVFVLAATSRPDLLDPALLRPGRLDKQILCALPDQVARMEILQALSQSMKFAKDVDLIKIASQSEGFSGADLQSILYSAHLSSVEHLLSSENNMSSKDTTFITQKMLELALRNTRPSLSPKEIAKYNLIYSRFFTDKTKSKERMIPGTKATLA